MARGKSEIIELVTDLMFANNDQKYWILRTRNQNKSQKQLDAKQLDYFIPAPLPGDIVPHHLPHKPVSEN